MHKIIPLKLFLIIFLINSITAAWAQTKINPLFNSLSKKTTFTPVEKVFNSGLIILSDGRKIKLIGLKPLDAPKRKKPKRNKYNIVVEEDDPVLPLEQIAHDFINTLLKEKKVRLEFDNQYRDDESYILAYVFLSDGTFVNAEILRQGFADLHIAPPNTKYKSKLKNAYKEARREKRGLQGE